jgi:NTP pyrophosphatase (non-canonical NTP hydrolase)
LFVAAAALALLCCWQQSTTIQIVQLWRHCRFAAADHRSHPLAIFMKVVREVIEGVEQLDQQLKRREPAEALKPRLQDLQERLGDLATLMSDMAK